MPVAVARENALRKAVAGKARAAARSCSASTRSSSTGLEIWGKPPDEEAARETLRHLAGRTHASSAASRSSTRAARCAPTRP